MGLEPLWKMNSLKTLSQTWLVFFVWKNRGHFIKLVNTQTNMIEIFKIIARKTSFLFTLVESTFLSVRFQYKYIFGKFEISLSKEKKLQLRT